ncbi:hypothetical protein OFO03_07900, partial [Campylobacter sp. JMF_02 ED1]|uniref:hypothetical protein n=1 Tax=Campylobacter sp. JMF_02 ED1 TaxID=2983826 RepID=UPI0022E9DFFE
RKGEGGLNCEVAPLPPYKPPTPTTLLRWLNLKLRFKFSWFDFSLRLRRARLLRSLHSLAMTNQTKFTLNSALYTRPNSRRSIPQPCHKTTKISKFSEILSVILVLFDIMRFLITWTGG